MAATKIEFTHFPGTVGCTWNLWAGCTKESSGCANCWALPMTARLQRSPHPGVRGMYEGTVVRTAEGPEWTGVVRFNPARLKEPERWSVKHTVFVQSMGDLFHNKVDPSHLYQVFLKMMEHDQHTYLLLTKRPANAVGFFSWWKKFAGEPPAPEALRHIWFGITLESEAMKYRCRWVRDLPFPNCWVNYEPALGWVNWDSLPRSANVRWVVAGGESAGRRARPPDPEWFRQARDFCQVEGLPFLFKQWGNWAPAPQGARRFEDAKVGDTWMRRYPHKKTSGRELDGHIWNEFPALED